MGRVMTGEPRREMSHTSISNSPFIDTALSTCMHLVFHFPLPNPSAIAVRTCSTSRASPVIFCLKFPHIELVVNYFHLLLLAVKMGMHHAVASTFVSLARDYIGIRITRNFVHRLVLD
jgi:hypothetical protein